MKLRSIEEAKNLAGKRIFMRADFNVPIKSGKVVSDFKMERTIPTIEFLMKQGAKVILTSHLGRPKGVDKKYSLKPVAKHLSQMMEVNIPLLGVSDWKKMEKDLAKMKNGEVVLLENIRFLKGEEEADATLSKKLAKLGDIFVFDGFAVAHRDASSVTGVAKYLPAYAGLLLKEEFDVLTRILKRPSRPLTVILGGAKADTKIPVLKTLLKVADHVLIGGGVFNTYLASINKKVGGSLFSKELQREVNKICQSKKIILPTDVVVGKLNGKMSHVQKIDKLNVSKTMGIYDIGPETVHNFAKYIKNSKTLVWNGAVGYFEQAPYQFGTYALVRLFAARAKGKAFGVCGGGETVEILEKLNVIDDIDLVSTGGGAMLEFFSGNKLPGIKKLSKLF